MKRLSIFLTAAALIWGMLGCEPSPSPAPQYGLTIASTSGGSVTTPDEGTFTYEEGTVLYLSAMAEEGYRFVKWTDDTDTVADVNDASTTITMNGHYSITANFEAVPSVQYSLTVASTAGGSVTVPGEGTSIYDEGTVVDLAATPDAGYQFVNWAGDVDTIAHLNDAITTITMQDDYEITASFEYTPMVAAGYLNTVGLKADGTVVAVGFNSYGQCDVSGWTSIVQVATGSLHTVGLKANGTVIAVGLNNFEQGNVGDWILN